MTSYAQQTPKSLTVLDLQAMKQKGEKISCLTAYDASFATLIDRVGVDVLLVGDSLGMVIQGQTSTVPVSIEDMVYHCSCVSRVKQRAFVIADMPFLSYSSRTEAAKNAALLMQKGGAQMLKLEGSQYKIIAFLVSQGIPVCGHLGLLPQSINQLGAYKVKGKTDGEAEKLIADAQKIEQAGASLLVLECVPASLGKQISELLSIPVIGIGAGVDCDGQVLVLYDMLGLTAGKTPKFSRNFMQECSSIEAAITEYQRAVKYQVFPTSKHSY